MSQATPAFEHISPQAAKDLFDQDAATFVDIRDDFSRSTAYIPASLHLDNANAEVFLQTADRARPLIVYCYHGNSSQIAAEFLSQYGFVQVYSMDGGFDAWQVHFPECYQAGSNADETA